jgi:hypothetical protein
MLLSRQYIRLNLIIGINPINRTHKVSNLKMYCLIQIQSMPFLTTKQVDRGIVDTIANSDELAAF